MIFSNGLALVEHNHMIQSFSLPKYIRKARMGYDKILVQNHNTEGFLLKLCMYPLYWCHCFLENITPSCT